MGELKGWIVPHDAVQTDATGCYLLHVAAATASRVAVTVLGAAGADDVVQGSVDPQRPVVVQGNYQLSDNTPVRASEAPAPANATQ